MKQFLILALLVSSEIKTFTADVQPIFRQRCAMCHNGKNNLPNLLDYKIAYPLRSTIVNRVTVDRYMPPIGQISETERNIIKLWVDQGAQQ